MDVPGLGDSADFAYVIWVESVVEVEGTEEPETGAWEGQGE